MVSEVRNLTKSQIAEEYQKASRAVTQNIEDPEHESHSELHSLQEEINRRYMEDSGSEQNDSRNGETDSTPQPGVSWRSADLPIFEGSGDQVTNQRNLKTLLYSITRMCPISQWKIALLARLRGRALALVIETEGADHTFDYSGSIEEEVHQSIAGYGAERAAESRRPRGKGDILPIFWQGGRAGGAGIYSAQY